VINAYREEELYAGMSIEELLLLIILLSVFLVAVVLKL